MSISAELARPFLPTLPTLLFCHEISPISCLPSVIFRWSTDLCLEISILSLSYILYLPSFSVRHRSISVTISISNLSSRASSKEKSAIVEISARVTFVLTKNSMLHCFAINFKFIINCNFRIIHKKESPSAWRMRLETTACWN